MSARRSPGLEAGRGLCEHFLTDAFFANHWERTPLHRRAAESGAAANSLPDVLPPDEVSALLRRCGPGIKMVKRGEAAETDDFREAYLDGYSLIANQADRFSQVLVDMCQVMAHAHFLHAFCVLYLTPPGSQAVRLHTDDQDVILLQVWGKKQWTIRNAPVRLPYTEEMLGKDTQVPPELIGDPLMQFEMQPHDVLYIPRGYLHEAATGGGEPSLHITITMPTSDYCWGVQLTKHLMGHLESGGRDFAGLTSHRLSLSCADGDADEEKLDQELRKLTGSWVKAFRPASVLDAFEGRMARVTDTQLRDFARNDAAPLPPAAAESCRVRLMPGICLCTAGPGAGPDGRFRGGFARFARKAENQAMDLPMPASAMPLLRALTSRPQDVSVLPGSADAFGRLCALQLLNERGVLQLLLPGRPAADAGSAA